MDYGNTRRWLTRVEPTMTVAGMISHLQDSYPRYINMSVLLLLGLANALGTPNPVSTAGYVSRALGISPQLIGVALFLSGVLGGFADTRRLYFASCAVFGVYVGITFWAGLRGELPFQPSVGYAGLLAYMLLSAPRRGTDGT